jgi:hypothetical protein
MAMAGWLAAAMLLLPRCHQQPAASSQPAGQAAAILHVLQDPIEK